MLRSVLAGLIVGLFSFAAIGWIVYSLLWWSTGQDEIARNAATPGVVLGGVWCLDVGVSSGAVIGSVTGVLTTLCLQRRRGLENNQQNASVRRLA